jgi:hypothetical protein
VHRLTLGRRKICEPYLPRSRHGEGTANAHRDRYRRPSRDWLDLVSRRDVPVGPRGQPGNEVGHAYPALRPLPPADLHRAAVPAMKA